MRKVIIVLLLLPAALLAQREPVLKQIDLPHPYYYREMYLPQLTSGPSWVTWSPDSKEVIYSMAGSLWRQKIDSNEAVQLTNGSGYDYQPDWSHDGKYVVYTKYHQDAMELWLLDLATGKASQLTKDGAVNVDPRWSPDGKHIAYVSTAVTKHFHIFLMEMQEAGGADLGSAQRQSEIGASTISPKSIRQLTKENVSTLPRYYYSKYDHEISPAWSPDGKDIIFVSNHGHIHGTGGIWRATVPETGMIDTSLGERMASPGPREPDARAKSLATEPSKDMPAKEIHYEETNWKARPEFSPDGKKIVYASYLGRQWHQLWLMPSEGGDVFPLTYGEYDNINPRWSPDGKTIGSIVNDSGNTELSIQEAASGASERPITEGRSEGMYSLKTEASIPNERQRIENYRVSFVSEKPFFFSESPKWSLRADDSFDRTKAPVEHHYFFARDEKVIFWSDTPAAGSLVDTPQIAGRPKQEITLTAFKGLDFIPDSKRLALGAFENTIFELKRLSFSSNDSTNWQSADLHVHMNYAGTYRMMPEKLVEQIDAEDVGIAFNLLVNKEQRFPDAEYADRLGTIDKASTPTRMVTYGQEFHTSYWGHLGLLNINHLILPGYAGYPNTAAASLVPMDADVADMAHAQNKEALVGWVHPFDVLPDPYKDAKLTNELPVDVALGKIDYYEVVGFSDHKASAAIWYRLLNLGFHLPAGAGTDAMTNFASLRGPVGLNRVYVRMDETKTQVPRLPRRSANGGVARDDKSKENTRDDSSGAKSIDLERWLKNLKAGKTFATNGPLLRFILDGQPIGGEVKLDKAGEVSFTAALRSIVPVDKVEVVCNGAVVRTIFPVEVPTSGRHSADQRSARPLESKDSQGHTATTSLDVTGTAPISRSGWCVLRAYSDHAEEPIMDIYPYGTTSPIYVTVAGEKPRSPEDARFFSKWIERIREDAAVHQDYNTPQEREHVLKVLDEAAGVYQRMQEAGGGR